MTKLFDINYDNIKFEEALAQATLMLEQASKSTILFLNAHYLNLAIKDKEYKDILNQSDLLLGDGIGIHLATLLLGDKMIDNCNGTDFSPKYMEQISLKEKSIFLLGGIEGVVEKAAKRFVDLIPGLKVAGTHCGYFDNDYDVIEIINNSKADVLFVGFGAPLQEKWIYKHREELNPQVCLGIGALFDYYSDRIKRAPLIIRKARLEWLWRIVKEPRRLMKRYTVDMFILFIHCIRFIKKNRHLF